MRKRPVILLLLIVALPLGLLTWLGVRLAEDEQTVLRQRFRDLRTTELQNLDGFLVRHFESIERQLRNVAAFDSFEADDIRTVIRNEPLAHQIVVLNPDGTVRHPGPTTVLNQVELDFLVQARDLLADRDLWHAAGGNGSQASQGLNVINQNAAAQQTAAPQTQMQPAQQARPGKAAPANAPGGSSNQISPDDPDPTDGWYIWYWGRGVNLIYWKKRDSGHIVAIVVERSRWMADLIAALPESSSPAIARDELAAEVRQESSTESQTRLIDSAGKTIYQWGGYEPADEAEPIAEVAVSPPLASWRLQAFLPDSVLTGAGSTLRFSLVTTLIAAGIGLTVLAAFFWRDYTREFREAAQRVSFVNQVSHELRTPLTNIRMYADMLASDLDAMPDEESDRPQGRLSVIVSESQRLSRLIGNVLTFARQQRKTLALNRTSACVDDVVRGVLKRFEPGLDRLQIKPQFKASAPATVSVDVDALEQILGNLFSNVEKYAADGGELSVSSFQEYGTTSVTVSDAGPGIPSEKRQAVFEPFFRLSNRLEDAAGTGIGLAIARELARMHGGDVTLIDPPDDRGATFRITLATNPETSA